MPYRLPLRERQRFADAKRWRYRVDPEYRLACINKERARHGREALTELPPAKLSEMQCPHRPKSRPAKNWLRARDEQGRFAGPMGGNGPFSCLAPDSMPVSELPTSSERSA